MKKFATMAISVALIGTMIAGGSLAYLQDTDSDVNVMTLGNVQIEQHEYERVVNADGTYATDTFDGVNSYVLKDFTQGKPLLPSAINTTTWEGWDWDTTVVRMTQVDSYGGMQVFKAASNAQDKFVTVENTGKTDAYVRTLVAIEVGSTDGSLIGSSYHQTWNVTDFDTTTTDADPLYVLIDGRNYMVKEFVYAGGQLSDGSWRHENGILPVGDTSYPNLSQVYIKSEANNEDMKAIDGNGNGTLDILVLSQAVQAQGFADAKTALKAAFGEANEANVQAWFTGEEFTVPVVVATADELIEALGNDKDVVLTDDVKIDPAGMSNAYGTTGINVKNGQTIDGNGNTLDIAGAGGTWDSGINTTGGTIKNITVTGSFRGIFINHNSSHSEPVILENVIIDGTTYTISCDQGLNQTLTATDSTFNGWTSYAATLGDAKFVNCIFGEGNGYAYMRPYAPTEFVGCEFETGYTVDPRAAVTFENCTLNGVALTADNLDTLVTDTTKATVK
ncbi:MAG: hypothetical protein IJE67_02960 [Peptococcaceae bacterium]|nr:hypothetical protein [Peptococcaceae bacterium]